MRRGAALAFALASLGSDAGGGTSAPRGCEELLGTDPKAAADCRCAAFDAGGAPALERAAAAYPDDGWPAFCLGRLESPDRPVVAAQRYRAAATAFRRAGHVRAEFLACRNLSNVLTRLNDAPGAARAIAQALGAADRATDVPLRAEARMLEARHLTRFGGDLELAHHHLREASVTIEARPTTTLTLDIALALGNVSFQMGRFEEAIRHFERLVALNRGRNVPFSEATARFNLANAHQRRLEESPEPGGRVRLRRLAEEALAAAVSARHTTAEMLARRMLAELQGASAEEHADALRHADACVGMSRALKQPRETSQCLGTAAAIQARSDPERALRTADAALAAAEGDPRALAFAWRHKMQIAWRGSSAERAWSDSRAALAAIESLREAQSEGSGRAALFSAWTRDYHWLSGRLLLAAENGDRQALVRAFEVVERMRARVLLERIGRMRLPEGTTFASLDEVEAALDEDEALLSFQVGLWRDLYDDFGGGAWLLMVTRGRTRIFRVADRTALDASLPIFRGLVERRDGQDAPAAARLGRDLLGPALAALPATIRRIVLVPDGVLHHLPFAALRHPIDGRRLVESQTLSIVPSATFWHRRRDGRPPISGSTVVFADPDAPHGRMWGRLPYARREGRAIARRVGGARLFVGRDATERRLKDEAASGLAVLHVAGHAAVDDARPDRSAVLLAAAEGEDGNLQPPEIAGLTLPGGLVVLPACRSASGAVVGGDGVLGLTHAFLQAGASAVVGGYWPLRDEETFRLVDDFYAHLARGLGAADSLRGAQLAQMGEGAPTAAWAGLLVVGDGGVVPLRENAVPFRPPWTWIAIVCAAAGLLAWYLLPRGGGGTRTTATRHR